MEGEEGEAELVTMIERRLNLQACEGRAGSGGKREPWRRGTKGFVIIRVVRIIGIRGYAGLQEFSLALFKIFRCVSVRVD